MFVLAVMFPVARFQGPGDPELRTARARGVSATPGAQGIGVWGYRAALRQRRASGTPRPPRSRGAGGRRRRSAPA
eukprot:14548320-Heterocapsa_arctica.AAC.1